MLPIAVEGMVIKFLRSSATTAPSTTTTTTTTGASTTTTTIPPNEIASNVFFIYPYENATINGDAMGNGLFVPSSTKVISCIAIDSENWICTKQRKSGGGNEGGTFTSFSVGLDESTNSFFEVTDSGNVIVGEHGIQQIPKRLNAIGTDIDSASIIPAGTSLVKVVLVDNNGGIKLPIASIGTEISLMNPPFRATGRCKLWSTSGRNSARRMMSWPLAKDNVMSELIALFCDFKC